MELRAPRWIIDDGPLDNLARTLAPADVAGWPADTFFVANATHDKASGRRRALLEPGSTPFSVFAIQMGTPASDTLYRHLREAVTDDQHLAEHEAIAWALHGDDEAIFVAHDKAAAFQALAELGRCRAAHPVDLWLWLRDAGHIGAEQFEVLCEQTRRGDQQVKRPLRTRSR